MSVGEKPRDARDVTPPAPRVPAPEGLDMPIHTQRRGELLPAARDFALAHGGVVDRRTLATLGHTYKQIHALVARGKLVPFRGAFRAVDACPRWLDARPPIVQDAARCAHALQLAFGPDSIVTGADAAILQGCTSCTHDGSWDGRFDRHASAVYSRNRAPRRIGAVDLLRGTFDGATVHRMGLLLADRETALLDILDAQHRIEGRPRELSSAGIELLDRCLQRGWLTPAGLSDRLARRLATGLTGCRRTSALKLAVAHAGVGTQSKAERRMVALLRNEGLRMGGRNGWRANFPVRGADSSGHWRCRVDFAWPACKLALEIDGRAFHASAESFQVDRSRAARLVAAGWTVIAFTWDDITGRPRWSLGVLMATLRRLGHPRGNPCSG
jgi:very-short-patch-repair endonuclease